MANRAIFTVILWVVLGLLLFNTCFQKEEDRADEAGAFRPETFRAGEEALDRRFVLENDLVRSEWSTLGGGCTLVQLKDFSDHRPAEEERDGAPSSHWLTLYRAIPAYPPDPIDAPPRPWNYRRRDALRIREAEGLLGGPDLHSAVWKAEKRSLEDGGEELDLSTEAGGVRFRKVLRLRPGDRHIECLFTTEALSTESTGKDLTFWLSTGGGILVEPDRFYPNPYVGGGVLEYGEVEDLELYRRISGDLPERRDAVWRATGDFDFVVEGSKYFVSAIRSPDLPFRAVKAEQVIDQAAYQELIFEDLGREEREAMAAAARAGAALLQEGLPVEAEALAQRSGGALEPQEALRWWQEFQRRRQQVVATRYDGAWKAVSGSGSFVHHIGLPGQQGDQSRFLWYVGPKDPEVFDSNPDYEPLHAIIDVVDYGDSFFYRIFLTKWIAKLILGILQLFHTLTGNWGVSIILMTILVRASLFPLNRRGQVKMATYQAKVARVKPELDAIKKKYQKDPQRLQQETLKIYQKHGMRPPLGGCLPMLAQFPVFIGLFAALRCSILLRQQPFAFWIQDLSRPDALLDFGESILPMWPFSGITQLNVLPLLMVILMIVNQSAMPKPADPEQQRAMKVMKFMPLMFGLFLYNYASGLSLYMITSSTLGILEARVIKKKWPVQVPGAAGN